MRFRLWRSPQCGRCFRVRHLYLALVCALALCFTLAGWEASAQDDDLGAQRRQRGKQKMMRGGGQRDQRSARPQGPDVGDPAPDFKLMPIKLYDFQVEGKDINREGAASLYDRIQLESFKEKKPVALFFGSYT